ncbi:glutamine synthetase family protein [Roseomonas indoligenes]|uniref:Glutamine synthetase n=1 Tax=Roseomonas indoligenes TaxID=2820811 RepID=A0A940N4Q3_9PROT|nr:glutamine synthetase family protein [Pararoseomonas indoligenes]MBP0495931.1 glutamine synthetase [Pararoseomonas indoligenes]
MDELVTLLTTDLVAITRGRGFMPAALEGYLTRGCGWVPANMALTPFDLIAEDNPWGSAGDLRLMPDPATAIRLEGLGTTPLHTYFSDITGLDGTPWECCPRSLLKRAVAALEREAGLVPVAAFEHEFQILGADWAPAPAFSIAAARRADPFGPGLMGLLKAAGLEPEMFLPEYGTDQFEVTCRPAGALAAADRAVALRMIVRELAAHQGWRASFAPKTAPDGVGNGVHIHLSFRDREGQPATYDPARPGGLSEAAGRFAAGVVRHMPALLALTAPSPLSYLRLVPHHWSAAYSCLGLRNREAALRICPIPELPGTDPAKVANFEFRATDATANPYLALAALIFAGLEGLRAGLAQPPLVNTDPSGMTEAERARLGAHRLPESLPAALEAFRADAAVQSWLPPVLSDCLVAVKRKELSLVADLTPEELCDRYAAIY